MALFDNSKTLDNEDEKILEIINSTDKDKIIVLNKCDLESKFDTTKIDGHISLSTKIDINPLINALEDLLNNKNFEDEVMLISKRQVLAVTKTLEHINMAYTPLHNGMLEFFSHHVTEAIREISSISRPYDNDEMLDKMFSSFCLGK